jgi:hypothetical protein
MAKQHKKVMNSSINERLLSPDNRAKFQEAKSKELQSFTVDNAQPERTLTARVLTKWPRHSDGALDNGLQPSSPTTSRTSRQFLSLTALLGWSA